VLVNRRSFSNATAVAATVQDYGFAAVIGEETADVPTGHGAAQFFDLPGLAVTVTYPKSYFVRPSGDEAMRGVVPDFPLAAARFFGADDMALADAVAIVRKQR
jgi:C-terminal processing protease CtpA/Prc